MTDSPPMSVRSGILAVVRSPVTVWAAFVLAHLWLGLLNLYAPGLPLGDVTIVYKFWIDQALNHSFWVGIDSVWVYPIVALVPMLLANLFGPDQYASTWLTMVMLLGVVAFGFITGWGRSRERIAAGWWWVGFLMLLGPIALARIDSVSVPLAMVGVLIIASRPRVAALLLTIATWIKVWPAAVILAAAIALRSRVRVITVGAVTSVVIVLLAVGLGSGANVFTFVTEQSGRGLQPESPVSTIWMWLALFRVPGAHTYYDQGILSFAVTGPGADVAIAVMTPLLALAVAVIAALGIRAQRAGASPGDLFPPLALALTMTMLAVNKVGSPQFIAWIAVPIVLGLVTASAGRGRSFRTPAVLGLAIAGLTQLLYPYFYAYLIALNPLLVVALTVRNILELVLLAWAVLAVLQAPRMSLAFDDDDQQWLPSVWPLEPEPTKQ